MQQHSAAPVKPRHLDASPAGPQDGNLYNRLSQPQAPGENTKISRRNRRPSMKFRPLHDRIVIRRLEQEEKSAGGIIIPDTAREKPQEGEVIAVGPGARGEDGKLQPLDIKAGRPSPVRQMVGQ